MHRKYTQVTEITENTSGSPLITNLSEKWGGGWMGVINRIKESRSLSVEITFQDPGP